MTQPTAALLWAGCRPDASTHEVRAAVEAGADLDAAADLAVAQRVSPLVWRALGAAAIADESTDWGAVLNRDSARCLAQSRLVLPRIGPLALAPLAAAGLEPLVIKGATLAGRYPDLGLRPMDDVDVVLPESHVEPAAAALVAAGWTRHDPPRRVRHELQFTHRELPGMQIDLHRKLSSWRNRANRMTTHGLWSARSPRELFGAPAFVLPPDLEFAMLAAHAAKPWHAFDRLIWVVDLAVVARAGELDWDAVARHASDAGATTALAVALTLATRLGLESPPALRRIDSARRAHALAPILSPDWPIRVHDDDTRASSRYALVDGVPTRMRLMLGELMKPTRDAMPKRAYRLSKRTARRYADRRRAGVS